MKRRDFNFRLNLVMSQVVKASGIARQHFRFELEGDREQVSTVTFSVEGASRTYDLRRGPAWGDDFVADAAAGAFGTPRSGWEASSAPYPNEVHVYAAPRPRYSADEAARDPLPELLVR